MKDNVKQRWQNKLMRQQKSLLPICYGFLGSRSWKLSKCLDADLTFFQRCIQLISEKKSSARFRRRRDIRSFLAMRWAQIFFQESTILRENHTCALRDACRHTERRVVVVVRELKVGDSIVRIHDDYFEASPQAMLERVAQITSDSYKRRLLEQAAVPDEKPGGEIA